MLLGIPSSFSIIDSNVQDDTPTLEDILMDGQSPLISDGMELQDGEIVFAYKGDTYRPRVWDETEQNAGEYAMDEILYVTDIPGAPGSPGTLVKVTGRDESGVSHHERPFEPEEYGDEAKPNGGFESDVMDWQNFTERYLRVKTLDANLSKRSKRMWYDAKRWYYFFYEECGKCSTNGAWQWSALDRSSRCLWAEKWYDKMYLRTCMKHTYKFESANDIKATHPNWKSPTGTDRVETYQCKTIIERGGFFYFRTHINSKIEYKSWTEGAVKYHYMTVVSPADIPGFKKKRNTNAASPFDGKGYTKARVDTTSMGGSASWTLLSTQKFNTIALGSVTADAFSIKIEDLDGIKVFSVDVSFIDNTLDDSDDEDLSQDTTRIIHIPKMMLSEYVVTVNIIGDKIDIGEILAAKSLDAGFTDMQFKHKLKDLSPKELDDWGGWFYRDGVKIFQHSGTVVFKIVRYDQMARIMKHIGGKKIVVNSSDTFKNEAPDGSKVFSSTMLIARVTLFELSTESKNKRIGENAKYAFSFEEIIAFLAVISASLIQSVSYSV